MLWKWTVPLALLGLPACGDDIRRVTVAELKQALDAGGAVAVDVRTRDEYKYRHIKGAASMPLAEIRSMASELPRDKLIVTYCA